MSSPESKELMKLFKCSTDVATKVVCAFAESKLLLPFSGNFQSFLDDQKHFFYHQWELKRTTCCHCPPAGCTIRKMNRMDNWIFMSFYNDNGIVHPQHIIKQGGIIQQRCLHKYVTRNIRLEHQDITVLHFVLLSSGKLNGPEMSAVETINDKRNSICHAWSTHCFSMMQMNSIWTDIDSAVSTLSNPILMPIFKSQIQLLRKYDFDKEEMSSLSSKLDKLNASLEKLSGRIATNNNINTAITNMEVRLTQISQQNSEDIKQAYQALSQEMKETAQKETQELKRTLQHEIAKLSFTVLYDRQVNELVTQEPFQEDSQECPVLWQLTTPTGWDLEEVIATLKDATIQEATLQEGLVKVKYVKKGSLIIMTAITANILNDQKAFETAVKSFLNKIVDVCHINTKVKAQVNIRLHILNQNEVKLSFEVPTTRVPNENKFVQTDLTKTDIETMERESVKPLCEPCEARGESTIAQYFCHDCQVQYCQTCTDKHSITENTRYHRIGNIPKNIYICNPCQYNYIINVAIFVCKDCNENLCRDCKRIHQSRKVSKDHKIQIISEKIVLCAICSEFGNQAQATCYCLKCEHPKPLCSSCAEEHNMMKQNKNHQLSKEIFIFKRQDVPNTDISKRCNKEEHKMMQVRLRDGEQHHVKKIETPSKPYVTEEVNKSDHIILIWEHNDDLGTDEFYQILMKQHPDGKWKFFQTPKPCFNRFVTIDGLAADTSYVFKVRVENTLGEQGPFSPESDVITTSESLAHRMMMRSELIGVGSPKVYRLPIQEVIEARNERSQTRKFILGTPQNSTKEKTIMMVGATGSGKSTMINKMANYVLGVKWEDPFRFTLIHLDKCEQERVGNETLSQTERITCYTICQDVDCQIDYTINIIDTPGFGHGLEQNAKIISQIRDLFTAKDQKGVSTLDAVCFILKAPDARLTTTQKYIFESILALFGNDMKNNICTLVTFADGQTPPVLSALKSLDGKPLPFETYFSFSNSALFVDNRKDHSDSLSPLFWKMGMQSCFRFFQNLIGLQTKSLLLTSEVLTKRQKLENAILHLQQEIDLGLSKMNLLQLQVEDFTKYKQEMHDNENFVTSGYTNKVKKVNYQMKDNYHRAYQKKTSQEKVLEEMFGDISILEVGIQTKTEKISEYGNRLKEIALRPDPLSNSDFIELFIESEKREKTFGYIQRIESLQQCKKRAEIGKTCQMFEHRLREIRLKMKASVDD